MTHLSGREALAFIVYSVLVVLFSTVFYKILQAGVAYFGFKPNNDDTFKRFPVLNINVKRGPRRARIAFATALDKLVRVYFMFLNDTYLCPSRIL